MIFGVPISIYMIVHAAYSIWINNLKRAATETDNSDTPAHDVPAKDIEEYQTNNL